MFKPTSFLLWLLISFIFETVYGLTTSNGSSLQEYTGSWSANISDVYTEDITEFSNITSTTRIFPLNNNSRLTEDKENGTLPEENNFKQIVNGNLPTSLEDIIKLPTSTQFPVSQGECKVSIDNERLLIVSPMYELKGAGTKLTFITFSVTQLTPLGPNQMCTFTEEEILAEMSHITGIVQLYIIFECTYGIKLRIEKSNSTFYRQENTLLFLNIRRCEMDVADVIFMSQVARLDTLLIQDSTLTYSSPGRNYSQADFSTLRNLLFLNSFREASFESLPLNTKYFSNISKLSLQLVNVNQSWSSVERNFPNLLSLALLSCAISSPPNYHWDNPTKQLPLGLSLTQEQNSKNIQAGINVAPNTIPRVLKLINNNFGNLSAYQFKGQLHSLILNKNQIKHIDEKAFHGLDGLQSLYLSGNYISELAVNTFRGLQEVFHLDLANNILKRLHPNQFSDLRNLLFLDLSANRLTSVSSGSLSILPQIVHLYLGWNQITSLESGLLPVSSPHFSVLSVAMNPLIKIPSEIFTTKTLKLIDMSYTGLHLEMVLESIRNLSLEQLAPAQGFQRPTIRLGSNGIKYFPKMIHLQNYTEADYENYKKLLIFFLSYCVDFTDNYLDCNCDLGNILAGIAFHIRGYNSIQSGPIPIDWSTCYTGWVCGSPEQFHLTPVALIDPFQLTCPLNETFCPDECQCFVDVNSSLAVDCSQKALQSVSIDWPLNVRKLYLQSNQITRLPSSFTRGLEKVEWLLLSNNSLRELPSTIFTDLRQLRELHINMNNLTRLPFSITKANLRVIKVADNPFECDCENQWIKKWLLQNKSVVSDWEDVMCFTSDKKWQSFVQTEDKTFGCLPREKNQSHITAVIVLLCILALLAICLAYFHQEIVACVFLWAKLPLFGRDIASSRTFIIHSEIDGAWVAQNISSFLSDHPKCESVKSLIDFTAGYTIKENISLHVLDAHVAIIIASDNFFNSQMCQEVLKSLKEIPRDRRCYTVVVNLNNKGRKELEKTALKDLLRQSRLISSKNILFKQLLLYAVLSSGKQKDHQIVDECSFSKDSSQCMETISLDQNVSPVLTDAVNNGQPKEHVLPRRNSDETGETPGHISPVRSASDEDGDFTEIVLRPDQYDVSVVYNEDQRVWSKQNIIVPLTELGYKVGTPDKDFIPGVDTAENIHDLLGNSQQLIYILSNSSVRDEWATFIFREATDLNSSRKTNYLCVVLYEAIDEENMQLLDSDIQVYLQCHTSLKADNKLIKGLTSCLQAPTSNQ